MGSALFLPGPWRPQPSQNGPRSIIFTDAQVVMRRVASEEPGPGQKYARQARKQIAALRKARLNGLMWLR